MNLRSFLRARRSMLAKVLSSAMTVAFAMTLVSPTKANTITVSNQSVVGGVFTYQISEDAGGRISGVGIAPAGNSTPFNSAGTLTDDYFTIYDFAGFTGAHVDPAGWSFVSQNVGPTDDNTVRTDSATIANLTWYKTGGSSGAGPFNVTGFSATSTLTGQNATGLWSSEDTQNGGGANDGRTNASIGTTVIPVASVVPEPASVLLLGVGLLGFLLKDHGSRFHRK